VNPERIPTRVYIRGEIWRVVWRDHEDVDWRAKGLLGETLWGPNEIHLDSALRFLPEKLRTVWVHELMHACTPIDKTRPKWLTDAREEELFELIDAHLATALAQ
jgi:hypothetical protein